MQHIYFDDSRHPEAGFSVGVFVCADSSATSLVNDALRNGALQPGVDEFKSSARMAGAPQTRALREEFRLILQFHCRLSVLVIPSTADADLGPEALKLLGDILEHPDIEQGAEVFFDQGLFRANAPRLAKQISSHATLHFEQDSRLVPGIQLADLAAHTCGTMLLGTVSKTRKTLTYENPSTEESFTAPLGWELWFAVRRNFLYAHFDPDDNTALLPPHGLRVSDRCGPALSSAAREQFEHLFLGCVW